MPDIERMPRGSMKAMFAAYAEAIRADLENNARAAGIPDHMVQRVESSVLMGSIEGDDEDELSLLMEVGDD